MLLAQTLGRSLVALREADNGFREIRWVNDVEVGVQQPDVERKLVRSVRAHLDDAAIRSVRRNRHCQRQLRPHLINWRMDANSGAIPPGRSAGGALHIPGRLIVGERPWLKARAARKMRQSFRSTSQASRYQRRPQATSRSGSAVRTVWLPSWSM